MLQSKHPGNTFRQILVVSTFHLNQIFMVIAKMLRLLMRLLDHPERVLQHLKSYLALQEFTRETPVIPIEENRPIVVEEAERTLTTVCEMLRVVPPDEPGPVPPGPSDPPQLVSVKSSKDNRNEPTLECLTGTAPRE